jgi:hypothetical protein
MLNQFGEKLLTAVSNDYDDPATRSWILSALAKLSSCDAFNL